MAQLLSCVRELSRGQQQAKQEEACKEKARSLGTRRVALRTWQTQGPLWSRKSVLTLHLCTFLLEMRTCGSLVLIQGSGRRSAVGDCPTLHRDATCDCLIFIQGIGQAQLGLFLEDNKKALTA